MESQHHPRMECLSKFCKETKQSAVTDSNIMNRKMQCIVGSPRRVYTCVTNWYRIMHVNG